MPWVTKQKYLGIQFLYVILVLLTCQTCVGDFKVNSIISRLFLANSPTRCRHAVHLVKTYCLPTLMYGCEAWTLTDGSLHCTNLTLLGTTVFDAYFYVIGEKARALRSSSVNRYHFIFC